MVIMKEQHLYRNTVLMIADRPPDLAVNSIFSLCRPTEEIDPQEIVDWLFCLARGNKSLIEQHLFPALMLGIIHTGGGGGNLKDGYLNPGQVKQKFAFLQNHKEYFFFLI